MFQAVSDRRVLLASLLALVVLAWFSLWFWGQSPYGRFLSHQALEGVGPSNALVLGAVFVAGWTLMTVAMMLPTSLPVVLLFRTLVQDRPNRLLLVGLLLGGYLATWSAVGLVIHQADWGLHKAVEANAWWDAHAWTIGAGTLMVAGVYQFTELKYRCLERCRSPLSFIMEHWHGGGQEGLQAFRLGVRHGVFCVGCCWSLMLLMFSFGVGNIGWMFVLGTVMGLEKNMPWGRRISKPLGIILLAWGLALTLESVLAN